ncbi:MAG: hypothetical protein A2Y37_05150 [Spirochaetes bacterium GWB1_60_80]|nr:MAG: Endonuclease/exonuclease/phosphatase family protein [candidate division Kazan bacterium GW2011_GWC1_52_13]OHD16329.1 MAG: hypothetical protein A2Y37_05150 [Spirochaetes bacterium GWB1_60_80]OHD60246.1 MAG: hypothetical protein A2Y32_07390 [Spirochaetes bacterium GWF1_60_12]HAX37600.1 hypothetical protein [Spirochaetaceae bacterium]HBO40980.1 hypothetical protein [Spirochaetaceae bacterium]
MKKLSLLILAAILALAACSNPITNLPESDLDPVKPSYDASLDAGSVADRAISLSGPDAYEQDDSRTASKAITPDGTRQQRNFYDDANDWLSFTAVAGKTYVIETWLVGGADTVVYLYDGSVSLASNDDKSADDYGSRLSFTAPASKTYYIKVYSYNGLKGANRGYDISVTGPSITPPNATITVASFNTCIFGNTKLARTNTVAAMAGTVARFDLVAMQEVGSNASAASDATCKAIMDAFIIKVNAAAGADLYSYVRGNQYAIVYRHDKLRLDDYRLYSGTQTFSYTPLVADFAVINGSFDFSVVTIHTSPSKATAEIASLKTAMQEAAALYNESDVICLGDYNADGSYYAEGTGPGLSGFDSYLTGIPNTADTTVATNNYTYDRVQMTPSMASDFANQYGVFHYADYYDVTICEGAATTAGKEEAISDHYPVWCVFNTAKDTD